MSEIEVANVVGMITFEQELDLGALSETFSNRDEISDVIYEPAQNHWLKTYFQPNNTYVAFYRSGRASIAGCDSVNHFHEVSALVVGVMRDLLQFDYDPQADVKNIVATKDLGSPITLELLAVKLGLEEVEYEPEQFPALIHRADDHVLLVFSTGKIRCTGLTDLDAVDEAIQIFKEKIDQAG